MSPYHSAYDPAKAEAAKNKAEQNRINTIEKADEMLMLLKDEARCFLCLNAVICWLKSLSPLQILSLVSVSLATIFVEVVLSIILPGGAVLRNINRIRDAGGVIGMTGVNNE